MVNIVKTCPLGHTCETVKDNAINRCAAYIEIAGRGAQGEEYNEYKCSIFEWQPILLLEIARTNRGQTQAIESIRNIQHNIIGMIGHAN
jgi:hypothetical protein